MVNPALMAVFRRGLP